MRPSWTAAFGLLCMLAATGCSAPSPPASPDDGERALAPIETVRRLELASADEGLARSLRVTLSLAPKDPVVLELLGERPQGQVGHAGLLELGVRWKDYLGVRPDSRGGSFRTTLPMGADGEARREAPFRRSWTVALQAPEAGVLARSVSVTARLHPVDMRTDRVRTSGMTLEWEATRLITFGEAPADGGAARVFLDAVGAGLEPRDERALVAAAVAALPGAEPAEREALFGALHFLTGQTQGRSVARWQTWWERQGLTTPDDG